MISKALRESLRHVGLDKLSTEVMRARGEYVPDLVNWGAAAESMCLKMAANRVNEQVVLDGIAAFKRVFT